MERFNLTSFNVKFLYAALLCLVIIIVPTFAEINRFEGAPNISGSILGVSSLTPSLLSVSDNPSLGIQLPFPLTTSLSFSNSKFMICDPNTLIYLNGDIYSWIGGMLQKSFKLNGLSPKEVSNTLSKELESGVNVNFKMNAQYLKIGKNFYFKNRGSGFLLSLITMSQGEVHIPGDAFSLIFSYEEGLQKGNVIDFKKLYGSFDVTSDISLRYGCQLKPVLTILNRKVHIAWGINANYKIGHLMMEAKMEDGYIVYDESNVMKIHANMDFKSAGIKVEDGVALSLQTDSKHIVNGHGFSGAVDISLFTDNSFFSLGLSNLGAVFWNSDLHHSSLLFVKDSITILDIVENGVENSFTSKKIEENYFKQVLESFLYVKSSFTSSGYGKFDKRRMEKLSSARAFSIVYKQPLIHKEAYKRSPVFGLVFENEFFNGILPIQIGWSFSNLDNNSSFFQLKQVVTRGLSFTLNYSANNDMLFRWGKGGEISVLSNIYFD